MQKLVWEKNREEANRLANFTNNLFGLAETTVGVIQGVNQIKETRENAEANRAYNIAKGYLQNKMSTDMNSRSDFGEKNYRDEISNYNIFDIQAIQEMNLGDGAKQKLTSLWNANKPQILSLYDTSLYDYEMLGTAKEINKTSQLIYNDNKNYNLTESIGEFNKYYETINPDNIPLKGQTNLLLYDDNISLIGGGVLANCYNLKRQEIGFDSATSLDAIIEEKQASLLERLEGLKGKEIVTDKKDNEDNRAINEIFTDSEKIATEKNQIVTAYDYLEKIKNNTQEKKKIQKIADDRWIEKTTEDTNNFKNIINQNSTNIKNQIDTWKLANPNQSYEIDFTVNEDNTYKKDDLNIQNGIINVLNAIDNNSNYTELQKDSYKSGAIETYKATLEPYIVDFCLNSNSYEEILAKVGATTDSNVNLSEIGKKLVSTAENQFRMGELVKLAKSQNIDLSTDVGKMQLKALYGEVGTYTDGQYRKIYDLRQKRKYMTEDDYISLINSYQLDNNTSQQLIKEYKEDNTKMGKILKSRTDEFINTRLSTLVNSNEDYKKRLGLDVEKNNNKIPYKLENEIYNNLYRLIETNGDNWNYADEKELNKYYDEIYKIVNDYVDKEATDSFSFITNDLMDGQLDKSESYDFIKNADSNILFSNGWNEVYNYLSQLSAPYEDKLKDTDFYKEKISQEFFKKENFDNLTWWEKVQCMGGLELYRGIETEHRDIDTVLKKSGLENFTISNVFIDNTGTTRFVLKDSREENNNDGVVMLLTPTQLNKKYFTFSNTELTQNEKLREIDLNTEKTRRVKGSEFNYMQDSDKVISYDKDTDTFLLRTTSQDRIGYNNEDILTKYYNLSFAKIKGDTTSTDWKNKIDWNSVSDHNWLINSDVLQLRISQNKNSILDGAKINDYPLQRIDNWKTRYKQLNGIYN